MLESQKSTERVGAQAPPPRAKLQLNTPEATRDVKNKHNKQTVLEARVYQNINAVQSASLPKPTGPLVKAGSDELQGLPPTIETEKPKFSREKQSINGSMMPLLRNNESKWESGIEPTTIMPLIQGEPDQWSIGSQVSNSNSQVTAKNEISTTDLHGSDKKS